MGKFGGDNPVAKAAICCSALCCVVLLGCSIAILVINRNELASVTYTCWYTWPYTTCTAYYWGCLASANFDDTTPCNYLYAVGALGIFSASLTLCFIACPGGMIGNLISAIFHVVWWAVAGDYFNSKYNEAHDVPLNNYRHAIMGLCWTNLSFSGVQFLVAIFGVVGMRNGGSRGGDYEDRSEDKHHKHKHEHQSHAEMTDQHPPPPMANPYPAPPPPAGGAYPPPPPPAGYPAL
ncbi:hypothetical protein HXX76_003274 [Chlamydomonas incerta]|uniref:Uncharacterized protein n=1 Tax=Chlamydomonas incerta TaxID=51695 RepID=A0A835W9K9_CHLIN|nr:hypothetical protein HXX76_003274 [Chlamydomonas incerta]|eukprot:KAG2441656.1 hypothetical protein HXX76_003274 [Chlamydomonas incerta]